MKGVTKRKSEMAIFLSSCTDKLKTIRPNATCLTVSNYQNNFGEVSNFSICFHVDYMRAVVRSIYLLQHYNPSYADLVKKDYGMQELCQAKQELLQSHQWTLDGNNPLYKLEGVYDLVTVDGQLIPGIKLHLTQDVLHLWGFILHKKILSSGKYPQDKRKPLTKAKHDLKLRTPVGRFRQFKLEHYRFDKLTVEGLTIRDLEVCRLDRLDRDIID